ncbi:hypothetical protein HZF08_26020 [Paenibacillus sp. CGMCC 1.16610]|uniref:hypothetical protein n=1 Tax=Paenibacillus TaxID=44249 RepID=UPI0012F73C2A|nr:MULTISPECIES: hypothetical protein [Paenibacillus]MBA2941749.1 hypothetical protein [Paenibacillus sp. CGMCC 1.16610]
MSRSKKPSRVRNPRVTGWIWCERAKKADSAAKRWRKRSEAPQKAVSSEKPTRDRLDLARESQKGRFGSEKVVEAK